MLMIAYYKTDNGSVNYKIRNEKTKQQFRINMIGNYNSCFGIFTVKELEDNKNGQRTLNHKLLTCGVKNFKTIINHVVNEALITMEIDYPELWENRYQNS